MSVPELFADALRRHQSGSLDGAEILYRQVLAADPRHADSLHLLGLIAYQLQRHEIAVELIRQAIGVDPRQALYWFNFAVALRDLGRFDEAAKSYREAIVLKPDYTEAHSNLGGLFKDQGKLEDAAACYRRVVALRPDCADSLNDLGAILQELEQLEQAADCYRRILDKQPGHAVARNNLAIALLGQGRANEAMEEYRAACVAAPGNPTIRWNLTLATLLRGDFAEGWREYEKCYRMGLYPTRDFPKPAWSGEDIAGRTVLLYADQGFGDTIQFVRYAKLVRDRSPRVVVECQPGLVRLLKNTPGIDLAIAKEDPLPAFDCHAALRSMPYLFGTTLETIPAGAPYIRAQPALSDDWRQRLGHTGPNIGVVWRGSPGHRHDRRRSIPPRRFAKLLGIPGVNWFSLQQDARPDETAALREHAEIADCGPLLTDWAETAALVSCLDLVVTVDTSVAHLAGALGKPVWVLVQFNPDWRWLLNRRDSPWYPSLRLFRQPSPGDWESVFADVRREFESAIPELSAGRA
jgi:tetratricopeptide (TPR) repeat protein